jgi:hypothetical protein
MANSFSLEATFTNTVVARKISSSNSRVRLRPGLSGARRAAHGGYAVDVAAAGGAKLLKLAVERLPVGAGAGIADRRFSG